MLMKETPCLQSERLHREMVTFAHGTPAIALIWWAPSSRHNMSKDSDFQHVGDGHDQHRLSVFFPCASSMFIIRMGIHEALNIS
mmetsp:Transcript_8080/g.12201  ORF Transcript_8080/g.12201 Transcript_8080/m.12201 type:complete len:84 (+) Transcript_8080:938-1189(+)